MSSFENKAAVVIGASSAGGLGEAVAIDLAQHGAKVVVAGRRLENARGLAQRIGGQATACDLADENSIAALMAEAASAVGNGGLDIVVNAGGQVEPAMIDALTGEMLLASAKTNLIGPMLAMKYAGRHLRKGGVYLQFTSVSAQQPTPVTASYAVCKAGLEHALRIAAVEYGARGIRYLGIAPGIVMTPMTAMLDNDFTRGVIEGVTPLGRMVQVADVVAAARFLVSDACYETGHTFPVTGGANLTRALLPQEFFPH